MAVDDNFFGGLANGLIAAGAGAAAFEATQQAEATGHVTTPTASNATITATTWYIIAGVGAAALLGLILLMRR